MNISPHLRNVVGAVAPALGRALAGPLGGVAAREIAGVLLGKEDASKAEIEEALSRIDATDLVTLRELETTFAARMQQLDVELDKIAADDRADARDMQARTGDWTPSVLAAVILTGFFTLIGTLMFRSVPQGSDEIVYIMVGILGGMSSQVANFFFGSSAGSKSKTDVIAHLQGATSARAASALRFPTPGGLTMRDPEGHLR